MKKSKITPRQILEYRKTVSKLSNSGKFKQAYDLSLKLTKQYLLGIESQKSGQNGYYSIGVGASRLALQYGLAQKKKLCLKWAIISENAWLHFFKEKQNWFNAYYFYAVSLGLQGRMDEMNKALAKGSRILKKVLS